MTTITGAWVPNGSTTKRMRLRVEYSVPSPRAGQSSVSVTMRVYIDARYSISDSSNTFSRSGAFPGSGSGSVGINVPTDGSQQLWATTKTVALTSSTQSQGFSFSLTGVDYVGASQRATVSGAVSIPAKPQTAPAAPTNLLAKRVSDGRQTLTWSATSTATAPISVFEVERWTSASNTWGRLTSSVPGSARSYAATGTGGDQRVQYRVRAKNAAGVSAWETSPQFYTTPKAATGVSATLSGSTVTVRWTNQSKVATHLDLQQSTRAPGGAWSAWTYVSGATKLPPSVSSRTVSGLSPATEYRWRVQTAVDSPDLYAHSSASNVIAPATPPAAPTLLAPPAMVLEGEVELRWRHASLDGSGQSQAQIEWQADGGEVQQVTISGATTSHTLSLLVGGYQWRARTRGTHAEFGPFSGWSTFNAVGLPTVTILAPDGEIPASRVRVEWAYDDPAAPQAGYTVELLDADGATLTVVDRAGAETSVTVPYQLTDATDYGVRVTARSGTGFDSTPAYTAFRTAFIPPAAPDVDIDWDPETGTAVVSVTNPTAASAAAQLEAASVAANLVPPPDWETASPQPWSSELIVDTTDTPPGADWALRTNPGQGTIPLVTGGQKFPAEPGGVIDYELWLKADIPGSAFFLELRNQNGARAGTSQHDPSAGGLSTGGGDFLVQNRQLSVVWTRYTGVFTLTQDTTEVTVASAFFNHSSGSTTSAAVSIAGLRLVPRWIPQVAAARARVAEVAAAAATVSNRVERSLDGGVTWEEIAADVSPDGSIEDSTAPLMRVIDYRAVAISADGAETIGESAAVSTESDAILLRGQDGTLLRLVYNLGIDVESGQEVALERYLGSAQPTAHYGQARPRRYRLSGTLFADEGTYTDGAELLGQPIHYRDLEGRVDWVTLTDAGMGSTQTWHGLREVSLTLEAITHG